MEEFFKHVVDYAINHVTWQMIAWLGAFIFVLSVFLYSRAHTANERGRLGMRDVVRGRAQRSSAPIQVSKKAQITPGKVVLFFIFAIGLIFFALMGGK